VVGGGRSKRDVVGFTDFRQEAVAKRLKLVGKEERDEDGGEWLLIGARWENPKGEMMEALGGDWQEDMSRLAVVVREEAKRSKVLEGSFASDSLLIVSVLLEKERKPLCEVL
jgi:hypothetical protein